MNPTPPEFEERIRPHRRELLAHCYRMLGSVADAEDALQETLLRAWKALPAFEGRSSLRTWLYRIASRVCLDAAERRPARLLPDGRQRSSSPEDLPEAPNGDLPWLEPAPASLYQGLPSSPEASVDAKQSVGLAFLTVIQQLPASQRAVLLLREVLGWSAQEVAELLEISVAAVNSALQRARASIEAKRAIVPGATAASEPADVGRSLLARYIRAWESGAPDELAAILRDDVALTMPPIPSWYQGVSDVIAFLRVLFQRVGPMRGRISEAAGTIAAALYVRAPESSGWVANSLHVLDSAGGKVTTIHAFMMPKERFPDYGLPSDLPADS